MLALLGGSVALAQWYVSRTSPGWAPRKSTAVIETAPVELDDLVVPVPRDWRLLSRTAPGGRRPPLLVYESPQGFGTRLTITALPVTAPTPPIAAMDLALRSLTENSSRTEYDPPRPFRSGTLTGMRSIVVTTPGEQKLLHLLAVVTQDGRRYWAILISAPAPQSRSEFIDVLQYNDSLLAAICAGAEPRRYRPAIGADLAAAGLAAQAEAPAGLTAVISAHEPGAPVVLLPDSQAPPLLHYLRIRATPDPGLTNPDLALSPQALLRRQFLMSTGRLPQGTDLAQATVNGRPAWRLHYAITDGVAMRLVRQVWWVRIGDAEGPGWALLAEVITEPSLESAVLSQLEATAAWLAATFERAAPDFEAMSRVGAVAAEAQQSGLGVTQSPAVAHRVIDNAGMPIGWQVETLHDPPGNAASVRSDSYAALMRLPLGQSQMIQQWAADATGRRFTMANQLALANRGRTPAVVLDLADGKLSMPRDLRTPVEERQTMPAPPGLLLPVNPDLWPAEAMRASLTGPAVVWMLREGVSLVTLPPLACVLEPAGGEPATWLLRPLASLDADRLVFDAAGVITRYDWHQTAGSPEGDTPWSVRAVTRERLLAEFPEAKARLDAIKTPAPNEPDGD